MLPENHIWKLFARCLNGEASPEEAKHFHELLSTDESLQQRYEVLRQFWNSPHPDAFEATANEEQIARILEKAHEADGMVDHQPGRKKLRSRRTAELLIACALVLIASGTIYFIRTKTAGENVTSTSQPERLQQLVAQKGSRSKSVLPDGSVVWLNAGSYLSFDKNFTGATREVYLNGEAFFDVVKQHDHPFIVHANGIDIKVLGTSFDVKSYPEEKKVEATLIRGLIQITQPGKESQKPVYLHPNEKLVIDLADNEPTEKNTKESASNAVPAFTLYQLDSAIKTENRIETAWIYNRLEFRGENFEELAKKLERWFNVKVIFEDEEVKQLSFKGSFENETVEQGFAALEAAIPFEYTINEHEVFIRSSKKTMP